MTPPVTCSTAGSIAVIEINNPPVNALSQAVRQGLRDAVVQADTDAAITAIVIIGAGRSFPAGADIKEFGQPMQDPHLPDVIDRIESCSKPVVAALHGTALGGGFEIALGSHYRIAAPSAQVGLPEIHLGLIPGAGGTQRLPRLVGRGAALRLLLTGDMIDAAEAYRLGLVDQVTTADELITTVRAVLGTMLANAPLAMAGCIEAVNRGQDVSLEEGCAIESDFFGLLSSTADMKEGMRAFLEKRPPQFTGR